jgi:hypothetical protein
MRDMPKTLQVVSLRMPYISVHVMFTEIVSDGVQRGTTVYELLWLAGCGEAPDTFHVRWSFQTSRNAIKSAGFCSPP